MMPVIIRIIDTEELAQQQTTDKELQYCNHPHLVSNYKSSYYLEQTLFFIVIVFRTTYDHWFQ